MVFFFFSIDIIKSERKTTVFYFFALAGHRAHKTKSAIYEPASFTQSKKNQIYLNPFWGMSKDSHAQEAHIL